MRFRVAPFLAVLLLIACACGAATAPTQSPQQSPTATIAAVAFPATLTDFQNRPVTIPKRPERVVSIGPSITEFLFALGAGPRVVGVDDFSDEPAAASQLEKVGGIKVNFEKVVSLKPDLVLSVKFSDGTIEKLASAGLLVLVVDPQSAGDVARTAILLGRAVRGDEAARLSRDRRVRPDEDLHRRTGLVHPRPHRDRGWPEHRGTRDERLSAALGRGDPPRRPRDHRARRGRL